MRGKVQLVIFAGVIHGITPAYAGKRQTRAPCGLYGRDHPRLCGEKCGFSRILAAVKGSPPPMRGKVSTIEQNAPAIGITPAYAGKSIKNELFAWNKQDHPRLCGEKLFNNVHQNFRLGSPPPMRGKVTFTLFHLV